MRRMHAAPICSPDVPQTNQNPASVGIANRVVDDRRQTVRKVFTLAPRAARRVDLDGKGKLGRWDRLRAVRVHRGLHAGLSGAA